MATFPLATAPQTIIPQRPYLVDGLLITISGMCFTLASTPLLHPCKYASQQLYGVAHPTSFNVHQHFNVRVRRRTLHEGGSWANPAGHGTGRHPRQ